MKRRVLIVDDHDTQRRVLREFLELAGHEVIGEGCNGREAIFLAGKLKPDLIIMDVKMPVMDGIEAAREISCRFPAPIIFYTVKSDQRTIQRAIEAEVMAYLVKPIREEELNPTIELAVSRFQEFETLRKELKDLKDTIEARKVIERAKGILMERQSLTEKQAFRMIQKLSMDRRRPMKEVAEAIIMAYEIGGGRL